MNRKHQNHEAQKILHELNICWHRLPYSLRWRIYFIILATLALRPEPVRAHWI